MVVYLSKNIVYLQVCVTAREDVPPFGPVLPDPPIFTDVRDRDITPHDSLQPLCVRPIQIFNLTLVLQSSLLRQFLLTKLINAEISCYKAERFSRLEVGRYARYGSKALSEVKVHSQSADATLPMLIHCSSFFLSSFAPVRPY